VGPRLNLGSGQLRIPGYTNVDMEASPSVEVVWDLSQRPWPFEDNSVEGIIAWHSLEHLPGLALGGAMEEIHRILKPGAVVYIKVPYKEPGPYNPFHFHVFDRKSFNYWIKGGEGGPELCLQERHTYFDRVRQEVVTLSGFPVWHIIHHLPSTEGTLFERDERAPFSRHIPAIWDRSRELREWLAKRPE